MYFCYQISKEVYLLLLMEEYMVANLRRLPEQLFGQDSFIGNTKGIFLNVYNTMYTPLVYRTPYFIK
jgi:hypothetical protein